MKVLIYCNHLSCKRAECRRQTLELTEEQFKRKTEGLPVNTIIHTCRLGSQVFSIVMVDDKVTTAQLDSLEKEAETAHKNLEITKKTHRIEEADLESRLEELLIMLRESGVQMPFDTVAAKEKKSVRENDKQGPKVQRIEE